MMATAHTSSRWFSSSKSGGSMMSAMLVWSPPLMWFNMFFYETGGVRTPTGLLLKFLKRCTGSPHTKLKKKNR
jgi:hypothetical protein